GYFFSSFLAAFFEALAFFSPLAFFSIFLSSFAGALVCANAEALETANIAATITDSSLLISFSLFVFEHGRRDLALPRD
ncbi:MAG TPA: hypothetical protein VEB41_05475, partial [Burkholderiales bacterium]|nr:hypothetical protein [Burkholderiales bacterium]